MALPPRNSGTMSDAIAMSSPSGRMSKRAKDAATKRLGLALFGPNCTRADIMGEPTQPSECDATRQQIARLRDLAARGMSTRKFNKEADRLEAQLAETSSKVDEM